MPATKDKDDGGGTTLLFSLAIFLSAFLLFQIQPLIGKFILPWFGGTPGVWTTCMLVFQVLLFGGYAYAHLTTSRLSPKAQGMLHAALLIAAICALPIVPNLTWKPAGDVEPISRIIVLLAATVGIPFFVLSSTGPLLQGWFSRVHAGRSPYRLYALSNVGSLFTPLFRFPSCSSGLFPQRLWPTSGREASSSLRFSVPVVRGLPPDARRRSGSRIHCRQPNRNRCRASNRPGEPKSCGLL